MNINVAIDIQEDLLMPSVEFLSDLEKNAIRLGIEALKRVKDIRQNNPYLPHPLLSGETK